MSFENHPQWKAVSHIHHILKQEGFLCFIAGGAVRDALLGRPAQDLDIATDATPEQVEALFEKTVMVGKPFGVCRVVWEGQAVEVTRFRVDGPYRDGRRPERVFFSSPEEDAKRRDLTINALFYDFEKGEVVDYVGGQKDLEAKILRAVGEPDRRFEEDKLRLLRAIRFHGQLGFPLEAQTRQAIQKWVPFIHQVSMERIRDEWEKIMAAPFAFKSFLQTHELGLWPLLFPGWTFQGERYQALFPPSAFHGERGKGQKPKAPQEEKPKGGKGLENLKDMGGRNWVLWFLLHHQAPGLIPQATEWAKEWKLPKSFMVQLKACLHSFSLLKNQESLEPVDLALLWAKPHGVLAFQLYQDLQGGFENALGAKLKLAQGFFHKGSLPKPQVTGHDLIQRGFSPGPGMDKELEKLYRQQLIDGMGRKNE